MNLAVLEDPVADAVLVDVIPPAEADEQTSAHVLHRPEVHGEQDDNGHEDGDEARVDPVGEYEGEDGKRAEEQVKEDGERISGIRYQTTCSFSFFCCLFVK